MLSLLNIYDLCSSFSVDDGLMLGHVAISMEIVVTRIEQATAMPSWYHGNWTILMLNMSSPNSSKCFVN